MCVCVFDCIILFCFVNFVLGMMTFPQWGPCLHRQEGGQISRQGEVKKEGRQWPDPQEAWFGYCSFLPKVRVPSGPWDREGPRQAPSACAPHAWLMPSPARPLQEGLFPGAGRLGRGSPARDEVVSSLCKWLHLLEKQPRARHEC